MSSFLAWIYYDLLMYPMAWWLLTYTAWRIVKRQVA